MTDSNCYNNKKISYILIEIIKNSFCDFFILTSSRKSPTSMLQRHKWGGDLRYDSSYEVRVSNTQASSVADCEYPLN